MTFIKATANRFVNTLLNPAAIENISKHWDMMKNQPTGKYIVRCYSGETYVTTKEELIKAGVSVDDLDSI